MKTRSKTTRGTSRRAQSLGASVFGAKAAKAIQATRSARASGVSRTAKSPKPLTALETRIMNVIWDKAASDEGSTVESIREELAAEGGELALPSVRTMLSILQAKKYVGRRKVGRRHVYEAKVTRAESRSKAVVDLVDRSFGGSATDLLETLIRLRIAGKAEWERAYSRVRSGSRGN